MSIISENNAFSCDSLRFVQLTSGLRIIGAFVFDMDGLDSALTTITIPSTINSIGEMINIIITT